MCFRNKTKQKLKIKKKLCRNWNEGADETYTPHVVWKYDTSETFWDQVDGSLVYNQQELECGYQPVEKFKDDDARTFTNANFKHRTSICKHFLNGGCSYGDKCWFVHDDGLQQRGLLGDGSGDGGYLQNNFDSNFLQNVQQNHQAIPDYIANQNLATTSDGYVVRKNKLSQFESFSNKKEKERQKQEVFDQSIQQQQQQREMMKNLNNPNKNKNVEYDHVNGLWINSKLDPQQSFTNEDSLPGMPENNLTNLPTVTSVPDGFPPGFEHIQPRPPSAEPPPFPPNDDCNTVPIPLEPEILKENSFKS